jgi:hypothetical protein
MNTQDFTKQDFTTSISVNRTPAEVFALVNDVRGWWTGEIDGRTDAIGEEFRYRYSDIHDTTQKITELVPGAKIVWHVTKSRLSFVKEASEWDGTDIVFELTPSANGTDVRFTHVGLGPLECYDNCKRAWTFYIEQSLKSFLTANGDA